MFSIEKSSLTVYFCQVIGNKALRTPLKELKTVIRSRLMEARDVAGYNMAAMRMIASTDAQRKQTNSFSTHATVKDVWAGLGLGSDVAAALQGRKAVKS